jgi:hypothetical protein
MPRRRDRAAGARRYRSRLISSRAAYEPQSPKRRAAFNRDLDIIAEKEEHPERSLTRIARRHHRSPEAFKRSIPTRKVGGRLELAPPSQRRLYRAPMPMLADVDGVPTVVEVTPSNDAQYNAIRGHDSAVAAATDHDDDTRLPKFRHRVVVDAETGRRYSFYTDGGGLRDAAYTGVFEISELFYGGGGHHDLDALLDGGER